MKASTAVSSSSSVPCHKSAAPSPSPYTWIFHLKSSLSSSQECSPPYSPCRLIFIVPPPVPDASPPVSPVPSLCWFTHACSGTFLSFILKTLRLPRNCYLCRVCTGRAMPTVENILCNPSTSSSEFEEHRSSALQSGLVIP